LHLATKKQRGNTDVRPNDLSDTLLLFIFLKITLSSNDQKNDSEQFASHFIKIFGAAKVFCSAPG
jgi:hypothetical protein